MLLQGFSGLPTGELGHLRIIVISLAQRKATAIFSTYEHLMPEQN